MNTVLVADDNPNWSEKLKGILEKTGRYRVRTASNPDAALELLRPNWIGVAVIDFRLTDGDDDDESGLVLAQNSNRAIPKIMISGFADEKQIRAAFGVDPEGRTIVFDFLSKNDIEADSAILVRAVASAFEARSTWDRKERESINTQLLSDYRSARRVDLVNAIISVALNIIFIGLLIYTLRWIHAREVGVVLSSIAAIGIIISEIAVNLFLAQRVERSGQRAENYHAELLQTSRFEQLFKAADSLEYVQNRDKAKQDVIAAFAWQWNKDENSDVFRTARDESGKKDEYLKKEVSSGT